jgi:hypothetical protein
MLKIILQAVKLTLSLVLMNFMVLRLMGTKCMQTEINRGEGMCNDQTNALVCNKTLIQMSHIKTLKITPTCFDYQMIIIRELFDPS